MFDVTKRFIFCDKKFTTDEYNGKCHFGSCEEENILYIKMR